MARRGRARRYHPKKNPCGVDGSGKPIQPKPGAEYSDTPERIAQALKEILQAKSNATIEVESK